MSELQGFLLQMAKYHQWAHGLLLDFVSRVSEDDYRRSCGLFFTSIHGTLNHLLLAERLWMARFQGQSMVIEGLDQEIIGNRDALGVALQEQAMKWVDFVSGLSTEALVEPFSYENTSGLLFSAKRSDILTHIFNHGTHHRGQMSTSLNRLGYKTPEMDLLYYLNPNA